VTSSLQCFSVDASPGWEIHYGFNKRRVNPQTPSDFISPYRDSIPPAWAGIASTSVVKRRRFTVPSKAFVSFSDIVPHASIHKRGEASVFPSPQYTGPWTLVIMPASPLVLDMSQELYKGIVDEWSLWAARDLNAFLHDLAQTCQTITGPRSMDDWPGPTNFRHQGLIPLPEITQPHLMMSGKTNHL